MEAKQVLEAFINEMKNFEEFWGEKLQNFLNDRSEEGLLRLKEKLMEDNREKRLSEIINIQEKFLSKKALSLKQDRRTTLTYQIPPEYNQIITSERKINDKKYEINVLDDDNDKKTYVLILEDGEWKIDQMAFMYYDKWKKSRQLF
ncbi:NTF2 fold immunity protein [Capnocytophaga felis]|uniref:NTF2 fold immunity protein domain-containing protein n=1 Tax=Capnocytophaga felis TaxID=2267611 RepID=A0A5M4BB82_9FLAO|nr:NTF2 fold immunity protein [Capnocytophaga felis]GET46819.1 hypothetical protein RCZ01_21210 [Capnocytophaga felis]GET48521.1 hypothetical protein RCZ02_13520 [Capnocytophaga felis]